MADDQQGGAGSDDASADGTRGADTGGADAGAGSAVPPRGWELPRAEHPDVDPELEALAQLLAQVLAIVPEELRLRTVEAVKALLEALRGLIDWLVTRLGGGDDDGPLEVHDIPIL